MNAGGPAPNSSELKNQQDESAEGLPEDEIPPPRFNMSATQISKEIGAYITYVAKTYMCVMKLIVSRKSNVSKLEEEVMSDSVSYRHEC